MAQGKLTPRQRMINMMYLVLTALLALNVSKEIINAFVTVNESLVVSRDNIDNKNKLTYMAFDRAKQNDAERYGQAWTSAQDIKKGADSLNKYIEDLKEEMVSKVEKLDKGEKVPELREMGKKDDYDIPTYIMCGDKNDGTGFKATELKKKMDTFKALLLKNIDDGSKTDFQQRLDRAIDTKDPDPKIVEDGKRTWEMHKFYHNPVVASVALLTKFQGDVKNAESQVIDHILASIDANIVKFDVLAPRVIADRNYVFIGQDYKADVFLSASSSTLAPEVFVGAHFDSTKNACNGCDGKQPLQVDAGGIAKYTAHPGTEGEQKWSGVIRVKKPDGSYDHYNFNQTFIAAKPTGVVSADKMNVLYIGVDNPMSISVPGVAHTNVKTSVSGGGVSLKPDGQLGAGHWIATASSQGEAIFTVNADFGGKMQTMGTARYRVKRLPSPVAMIAGSKGGPISKSVLAAQSAIIPVMENFDFELFPRITGFRMSLYKKGSDPIEIDATDNRLTSKMQDEIRKAKVGDKVYFEYIKGSMPDGSRPTLSAVGFVLN